MFFSIAFVIGSFLLPGSCTNSEAGSPQIVARPGSNTIETRFPAPSGFKRMPAPTGSFGAYLRQLRLKPEGAAVHYYNGQVKPNTVHAAVVDLDVGTRDLQQCADAIMRLRAEWLWQQQRKSEIVFLFTDGFRCDYASWRSGKRIAFRQGKAIWKAGAAADSSYASFRKYMDLVFSYASTISLAKTLKPRAAKKLAVGDVFIRGGSPGHAVIVVDIVQNPAGEKRFLLAQSYMPAQQIHVLKNHSNGALSPWYSGDINGYLQTPEWDFYERELKTW